MTKSRPTDAQALDALLDPLSHWMEARRQSLLEELAAACQMSLERLQPNDALLDALLAAIPPGGDGAEAEAALGQALDALESAGTQSEALQRLLDGLSPLAPRTAIFILKQGAITLYASRGVAEAPRGGGIHPTPDLEALLAGRALAVDISGPGAQALSAALGPARPAESRVLPLRLKRKIVALVLVDSGAEPEIAHPGLCRALVLAASAALAAISSDPARSGGHEVPASVTGAVPSQRLEPITQSVPALPEPPRPMAPPPVMAPPPAPQPASRATAPVPVPPLPPPPPPPAPAAPSGPQLDPKIRSAAERLARVLVGDIELYFPAKVAQARTQGNLYGLLREELERSRMTFLERFTEEVESQHAIFLGAVVGQLCDGDPSKLGKTPW